MLVNAHWSDITQEGPAYTKASFCHSDLFLSHSVTSSLMQQVCDKPLMCVCMAGTWEWDVKQNVGRHC
jgi:hypothetical protein